MTGSYDILSAIDTLMPGVVVQRALIDAATAAYVAKGAPLVAADVPGILTAAGYPALPSYPSGMPRFEDSNASPSDGWTKYGTRP